MGMVLLTESGTFTPSDYGIREGDLMTVICVGGGGGGGSAASTYISNSYSFWGCEGGAAGKAGLGGFKFNAACTMFSAPGGGGGGFGAGGGGGAMASTYTNLGYQYNRPGGAGGNAGCMTIKSVLITEGNQDSAISVTIGAAGTGGTRLTTTNTNGSTGNAGGNGGTTSFGTYASAAGGYGGYGGTNCTSANTAAQNVYASTSLRSQPTSMALGDQGTLYFEWCIYGAINQATAAYIPVSSGGGGGGGFVLGGYVGGKGGSHSGNCGGSGRVVSANGYHYVPGTSSAPNTSASFEAAEAALKPQRVKESLGHGFGGDGAYVGYGSDKDTAPNSTTALMDASKLRIAQDGTNIGGDAGKGCVVVMW